MKNTSADEFQKEKKIIETAEKLIDSPEKVSDLKIFYRDLLKEYKRLLKQTKILMKVSDNQQRRLKLIMDRLGKYVSHQLVKKIIHGKEKVELKTTRKRLTVFFSDIKDFSYISSHMEGEELAKFLNSYLDEMTKIVTKWGGNLDKYWGDAILAFFGDSSHASEEKHALQCVSMSIEMQQKMKDLQKIWFEKGYQEPLQIRIGIATGYCAVGNFGSSERMDYTIIGNPVNFAARLESAAEPNEILISHETWGLVKNKINCEPYVSLSLKGFHKEKLAHKVLGFKKKTEKKLIQINDPDNGINLFIDLNKAEKDSIKKILSDIEHSLASHQ